MSLGDPFGRLAKQDKIEYEALQRSLAEAGVDSREKAEALLSNIRYRALAIAAIVAVIGVAISLFLPQFQIMVIITGFLILLWLFTTSFKGKRLIDQYISDNFSNDP